MPARALSARRFVVRNALADVRSDGAENGSHFPVFLPTEGRFYSNGSYCSEDSAEMRIYDFDVPIKPVQPGFSDHISELSPWEQRGQPRYHDSRL